MRCYNRRMEAKLLLIAWMVSVGYSSIPLYWFAVHPFAGSWRKMRRSPYRLLLPLWTIVMSLLALATWRWHAQRLYASPWAWLIALPFFIFSLRTYTRIASQFGTHKFTGEAELRPGEHGQEIVTGGLHARMRHPIYVAHLASLAGWAIGSGLAVVGMLLAVDLLATFPLMIWLEERELVARFGSSYREYQRRVPLLPVWWHGAKGVSRGETS